MADESRARAAGARCLHALVPELPWHRGEVELAGRACRFELRATRQGISHVVFTPGDDSPERAPDPAAVRTWLGQAGCPVVGEVFVADPEAEPAEWLQPARKDASSKQAGQGGLAISQATARALRAGHPWVIADAETGPLDGFAPGALVRLEAPRGQSPGLARIDDGRPVAARLWAADVTQPRQAPSIEARVARALSRREPALAKLPAAGALRLVHGEADGLPGLHADWLGGCLRVVLSARCALPLRERVVAALAGRLAPASVVEVIHMKHAPPGRLECVRPALGLGESAGEPEPLPVVIEEDGLRFRVEPGLAEPHRARPGVGFFLDQRSARAEARRRTREGGRYLNLFAHTGAFSAVLLAAGAGSVTSVDLSASYLEWLEENLALSDLIDGRHTSVQREVRRFLDEAAEADGAGFDGIVLDPPTAAAAGRRFLATRRELADLVAAVLRLLADGGWLYVSRNDRRSRGRLTALVEQAAQEAGIGPVQLTPGRIPEDFPELPGFPEGTPFEACWLSRRR